MYTVPGTPSSSPRYGTSLVFLSRNELSLKAVMEHVSPVAKTTLLPRNNQKSFEWKAAKLGDWALPMGGGYFMPKFPCV